MANYAIVGFSSLDAAFSGNPSDIAAYAVNASQIRVLSSGETLQEVAQLQPPFTLTNGAELSDVSATIQRVDPSFVWRFIECQVSVSIVGTAK